MAEPKVRDIYIMKILVLGLSVAAYFYIPGVRAFIEQGISYLKHNEYEQLRNLILSYGMWAPITSIVLMSVQSLVPLVPGIAVTIANAWIFGWFAGSIYSWIGALVGALLDFGIARWYGRPVIEKLVNSKCLNMTDVFFHRHGVAAVFITRLTPVVPFKIISYGAGLTAISVQEYIMATGIGQTPGIVLYSILGQNIRRSVWATVVITILLVAVGILAYRYRESIEKYLCRPSK